MRFKNFGGYGWDISCLSIGSWTLGGKVWGGVELKDAIDTVHALVERGVNHLDTALAYSEGECEKVVAKCIKGIRDKLYITTKGGTKTVNGEFIKSGKRQFMISCCEESLKNLEIDYIDNYMIHWPDENTPFEEALGTLADLKKRGLIRHVSVSNFTKEQILEAEKYCPIESVQLSYNMADRTNEGLLKWAHKRGMGTMSYSSLGSGVLTGQYRSIPKFAPDDARAAFFPYFKEPLFSKIMKVLEHLDVIKEKRNVAIAQIAVNWSTQKEFIDTALCGARDVHEAKENCDGFEWQLTEDELLYIDKAIEEYLGE
jgi:Predicted oxidoreductases (related to aryl-alcohol dehydrogenases)